MAQTEISGKSGKLSNWGDSNGPVELSHLSVRPTIQSRSLTTAESEWEPFDDVNSKHYIRIY